MKTCL